MALAIPDGESSKGMVAVLRRSGASTVFPRLRGAGAADGERLGVCWLDRVQILALARENGCAIERRAGAVLIDGLELKPTYEAIPAPAGVLAEEVPDGWQYWNSSWEFHSMPGESASWWRVRPNSNCDPAGIFRRGGIARGTSAARPRRRRCSGWATPSTW